MIKSFSGITFCGVFKISISLLSLALHVINKRPQAGHQQVVPLFCQCRQPEGGKMAQCDGCKEWYHDDVELHFDPYLIDAHPTCIVADPLPHVHMHHF